MTNRATIEDSSILEIRNIPVQLILYAVQQWKPCYKYAHKTGVGNNTNTFIKGISVWLILKSETTSGIIKSYRSQLDDLAYKCKMSVRTLDKYISWLKSEGLLQLEGRNLVMRDFKSLGQYNINIKQRHETIYYDISKDASLHEIITAIAFRLMKEDWMDMYWKKITKNPDEYKYLYDLLKGAGANADELNDPELFRTYHLEAMLQSYEEDSPGQQDFLFLHKHIQANPDLNCKAITYANKLGYNAAMSFCHLKFRLKKKGLISVEKGHVEGYFKARKDENVFHHRWLKDVQRTIWFRVDQIEININEFLLKKLAA